MKLLTPVLGGEEGPEKEIEVGIPVTNGRNCRGSGKHKELVKHIQPALDV